MTIAPRSMVPSREATAENPLSYMRPIFPGELLTRSLPGAGKSRTSFRGSMGDPGIVPMVTLSMAVEQDSSLPPAWRS
jgi:hypothetical protein